MIGIFIKNEEVYSNPLKYILRIFANNKSISITFLNEKSNAHLIFDHTDPDSRPVNVDFFNSLINKKQSNHKLYFSNEPYIRFQDKNSIDWLGTAFYMINSFQEYDIDAESYDNFGRFRYEMSYQFKFDCIDKNLVQTCFDGFEKEQKVFDKLPKTNEKTKVFISHDIDTINGSFLQDGLWALKKGRLDVILKLVMNEILLKPDWKNMDKIVKLHSEHDLKSTFFWLATTKVDKNGVKNADYTVKKLKNIVQMTGSNGLHKSAFNTTFEDELKMLPFDTTLNRYHFLKFTLPGGYDTLGDSKIKFDASLGFAERYGFRNNYALPFKPYNVKTQKAYPFVEVPLNVMDGTFHRDMKIPLEDTALRIIDFLEKNKINSIISILWHNTYFTSYKYAGYLNEYKKVLLYLNESRIQSITPDEIIKEFSYD